MCSSPKGSTTRRRHSKKTAFSRTEYEEYALMVRRASICYGQAQTAAQQAVTLNNFEEGSKVCRTKQPGMLSTIKVFLMQSMILKRVWR